MITETIINTAVKPTQKIINPTSKGKTVENIFPAPAIPAYIVRFSLVEISNNIPLSEILKRETNTPDKIKINWKKY